MADLKTAVFCFGRFNPPTIGHGKLLDALISVAKRKGGRNSDTFILASHSVDSEKNPLTKDQKAFYLKKMFPKQMKYYDVELNKKKLFLRLIAVIFNKHYDRLIMVAGSDRVREFQTELDKFNGATGDDAPLKGASYNYKEIEDDMNESIRLIRKNAIKTNERKKRQELSLSASRGLNRHVGPIIITFD